MSALAGPCVTQSRGKGALKIFLFCPGVAVTSPLSPGLQECDPENQKVRQKLKAKEWDELIAKGKRLHVLQPVRIGCVWERAAQHSSSSADLKVLQQFTACVLEPPVPEEEQQTQKCSKKRAKDQQSKTRRAEQSLAVL